MKLSLLKRLGARFIGMVGGEAMQSAFHFALNIALVQLMAPQDYGVFAIVMVIGGLGLTYVRAFCGMPASIYIGRSHSRRAAGAYDVTFGSGALVLSAVLGLVTAAAMGFWNPPCAWLAGGFVALWCLRSYLRMAMFAFALQRAVVVADTAFTLAGAVLALALLPSAIDNRLQAALTVLLAANGLGVLAQLLLARRPMRFSLGAPVRRRYGRLWHQLGWSGISVTTANLQGQALSLLVAGFAGPAAYAPIAAGLVLFVPLRIIATALANLMQPIVAAHVSRGETARMWQQAWAWSLLMAALALAYGAVALLALPYVKMQVFSGTPIYLIGFSCWAIFTATMLYVMPRLILEAAGAFRQIAVITALGAAAGFVLVCLALVSGPPVWSLVGAFVSEICVLLACWEAVRRMFPQHGTLGKHSGPSLALPVAKP